jgi:chaperonin GroEL (HSP60 family)
MDKYDEIRNGFWSKYKEPEKNDNDEIDSPISVNSTINKTNIVSGEKLREIQNNTLKETSKFLSKTFGPMGSNTKIIKGQTYADISSIYSKDGLKVLKNIINSGPIEASIVEELVDITTHVEKEVGDGTTSTVILSSFIFDKLRLIEKKNKVPPFQLIRLFKEVVELIKEQILTAKKDITLDDIYNISMISTNGNEEVSSNIRSIYEEYGMDVNLSVGISNDANTDIRIYDGLTINEGMSDPAFINNRENNTCEIDDAHIYHFRDPIDTMEMIKLFESIMIHNIYEPLQNDEDPISTVIVCPRLSKDMTVTLKNLIETMYQYDRNGSAAAKPPVLIVSNVVASDEIIMDDIANLCGCKSIGKYIDPEVQKKDIEDGTAPTVENVWEFCGHAQRVVSDSNKTKFINPDHMIDKDENPDPIYTTMINFLETEIANAKKTENANTVGLLQRRLSSLKANMIDYLVGGVTVSERDATKDLVEDAIKNCKSAALYGTGYAANYEGLVASYTTAMIIDGNNTEEKVIKKDIASCIFSSYIDTAKLLYGTVCSDEYRVESYIKYSVEGIGMPYNISKGYLPDIDDKSGVNVRCSIMLDINILDTISKIITMMVTCNQCCLQASNLNIY